MNYALIKKPLEDHSQNGSKVIFNVFLFTLHSANTMKNNYYYYFYFDNKNDDM